MDRHFEAAFLGGEMASGRMKRVLPIVSSSTIFVILTLPTVQCIRRFLRAFLGSEDAVFRPLAQ
jgi:hypothetical protein